MRHCIIMTAYKDIEAINRFIASTPDDWGIYIHIDRKSAIAESEIEKKAHVFKFQKVYWGSWEHPFVILYLMEKALSNGNYDYYHIVSGQDFYAMSPKRIDDIVKKYKSGGGKFHKSVQNSSFYLDIVETRVWYFPRLDIGLLL